VQTLHRSDSIASAATTADCQPTGVVRWADLTIESDSDGELSPPGPADPGWATRLAALHQSHVADGGPSASRKATEKEAAALQGFTDILEALFKVQKWDTSCTKRLREKKLSEFVTCWCNIRRGNGAVALANLLKKPPMARLGETILDLELQAKRGLPGRFCWLVLDLFVKVKLEKNQTKAQELRGHAIEACWRSVSYKEPQVCFRQRSAPALLPSAPSLLKEKANKGKEDEQGQEAGGKAASDDLPWPSG